MVQLLVQVPEKTAKRLSLIQDQLPDILDLVMDEGLTLSARAYEEILEFLASDPTENEIVDFRLSRLVQDKVHEIQGRHNQGQATSFEQTELQRLLRVEHLMRAIKTKALALNREG